MYEPLVPVAIGGLVSVSTIGASTAVVVANGPQKAGVAALFLVNALGKAVTSGPQSRASRLKE